MAGPEPSTTRRALLGAAAVLPVAAWSTSVLAGAAKQSSQDPAEALAPPVRPEPVEGRIEPVEGRSFPPAPAEWNERLARYRRLAERARAAAETGWFRRANDRYRCETAELDKLAASAPARPEEGPSLSRTRLEGLRRLAFQRIDRAEDLYWRRCTAPLQQAATALALTRAPDLQALRQKLAAIRAHQLHEEGSMARGCFEVLEEDVGRMLPPPLPPPPSTPVRTIRTSSAGTSR